MTEQHVLHDLHPFEYEHAFDTKALDALQKTPGIDRIVRQYNKHAVERIITIQYTGSNIKITNENYPKIHSLLEHVCETINLPLCPDLYVQSGGGINSFTIGVDRPVIILTSDAINQLENSELLYLIGHEVGHVKSRHTLYHQIAQFLPVIADVLGQVTLGLGKLLSSPLQLALMRWFRMSEFTADRAGLLACQSRDLATRVMIKLAGMPSKYYDEMNIESFIQQARDFEKLDYNKLNKAVKFLISMQNTHPWTVLRAAELFQWIDDGDYEKVLQRKTRDRLTPSPDHSKGDHAGILQVTYVCFHSR